MADQVNTLVPSFGPGIFYQPPRGSGPPTVRQTLQHTETLYFRIGVAAAAVSAYGFIQDKKWAKWAGAIGGIFAGWQWWQARKAVVDDFSAQETKDLAAELARTPGMLTNPAPRKPGDLTINALDGGTSLPGEASMNGLDL